MDLYTTSFTLPRPTPRGIRAANSPLPANVNLPSSGGLHNIPLPNVAALSNAASVSAQAEKDWAAVQKMCLDITSREGCLVTVSKEIDTAAEGDPNPAATVWNFHLSGGYQSVMAARGAILRETPRDNRVVLKVPRTDVLESPLGSVSPLKKDVRLRLDEIATESHAHIAVINNDTAGGIAILATADGQSAQPSQAPSQDPANAAADSTAGDSTTNSVAGVAGDVTTKDVSPSKSQASAKDAAAPSSTGPISYGLETERMCELVVTGSVESVEVAKVRLLVMLDELSGLHAECCDIDYKLHAIIASRKRAVIQSIQEETATNIYYPTPLVGVLNPPQPGSQQGVGYRNLNAQPTGGMAMQPTGQMHGTHMHGGMNGMGAGHMGPNMTGGMGVPSMGGMGAIGGGFPYHQQRPNAAPAYNPHQHVQYPYQPQPMDINAGRGMPYNGPGAQHFGPMNGMGPMQPNHTGMSTMHTGFQGGPGMYQGNRGMASPMQMHPTGMHGPPGQMGMGGMGPGPNHMPGPGMGMGNNMQIPYGHQAQNHMHVGLGGGPMGMNGGMNMGQGGMNMGQGGMHLGLGGMGQFGSGPHPGLSVHGGEQGTLGKANQIWITGEFFGVQRARDMLLNIAVQKSKLVISRDTAVLPRKLDWLLTERIEELRAIMADNGTYIQAPSVGSQASLITVFGDHRVNIERTIRSVMAQACQFYVASLWLLPVSFDVLMPQTSLNPAQMQPILKRIAHSTGAEVVFKSNCFEMHGLEREVRAAVMMILELDVIHNFHHEIRFQIELANEHREFISGKKNGKINKIMKMAGVKIKFETFNDYNFLMDISGSDLGSLQGLTMLQEELPAEVSFHVPEAYHKRIIGVGGKNIQRIMKLYGVYVKFSNAEEFAALGGYMDNEDNVVARTPGKNAINLEMLKQSVMEMVNPKDKDYTVEGVSIPRRYHRTLLGEKSIFIHDIEHKTNSVVRFPYKETASDIVTIFGPESQVHIAAAMLLDHVPFEADLHVPPNPEVNRLISTTEFLLFAERVKRDHQIAIVPSAKFGQGDEAIFKFRCQRSNIDFLGTARDSLEEFLAQHNVS
ncbi:hypothetical protein BCR39DRAFT_254880 [Naematelia encephala]|uniref:K Homology domain-containing protein n=1 Tax=Naematelia encephala TaxID=71784 RepID=A0A1Y2AXI7_9TREE|nr:hypothetical protein BCR39DRAFT_254880 [Naematelia encephala]